MITNGACAKSLRLVDLFIVCRDQSQESLKGVVGKDVRVFEPKIARVINIHKQRKRPSLPPPALHFSTVEKHRIYAPMVDEMDSPNQSGRGCPDWSERQGCSKTERVSYRGSNSEPEQIIDSISLTNS